MELHGSPVFTRTWRLPTGPTVRLRMARPSDAPGVLDLLRSRGTDASTLDVRRLLAHDPTTRAVMCALAPIDGRDRIVGVGAMDLRPGAEPDALVVDERLTEGLGELLGAVLRERAAVHARLVA